MELVLLDRFVPTYDFHEVHSQVILATPQAVFTAIKQVTPAEMPLVGTLLAIRALPARLTGKQTRTVDSSRTILEQALSGGFLLLGEEPGREIVIGTIGQFWVLRGGDSPSIGDPEAFLSFDRPGYAKAVLNFLAVGEGSGHVGLSTETRISALDPGSRRQFARYWRLIYPGSALIRRIWLRAIKRRAEQMSMSSPEVTF